jgi:hypothetical protein
MVNYTFTLFLKIIGSELGKAIPPIIILGGLFPLFVVILYFLIRMEVNIFISLTAKFLPGQACRPKPK